VAQTHTEKTRADKTIVGFEYQYWFFLWKVLQLRTGESVGLEVADDVHTQLKTTDQVLFQLKHTLQTSANGETVKLTKYDSDLWKTLSNWAQIISDKLDGRTNPSDQLLFLQKTEFVLVSNKSDLTDKAIIDLFAKPENAVSNLAQLKAGTKSKEIGSLICEVSNLDNSVLSKFLTKVSFMLGVESIIARCETAILEKQIRPDRVGPLLNTIDSRIQQDNFLSIKAGAPICVTFDEFNRRYRGYFDDARSVRLRPRNDYEPLPHSLEAQVFIKQLIDIAEISVSDLGEITALSICKQRLEKSLTVWELEGDITRIDLESFDLDSITRWKNEFSKSHRDRTVDAILRGVRVLDSIRSHTLTIRGEVLDAYVSNGQFYRLADVPLIGFLLEWEELYRRDLP